MSDEENKDEELKAEEGQQPKDDSKPDSDAASEDAQENGTDDGVEESVPDFDEQSPKPVMQPATLELNRFGGVKVALTAQLGRADVTIQEMMTLTEGAVVELDREISQPVELIAQGVPLGNGEVVVVEDRFAIRIKEIYQS